MPFLHSLRVSLLAVVVGGLGLFVRAAAPGTNFVAAALAPHVAAGTLPGAISILCDGERIEKACVGFADVEAESPLTCDTLFAQCSQTKGFCGVTVAKLVEEGKVRLDDPVSKYLPEFRRLDVLVSSTNGVKTLVAATNAVTLRMVLSHRSGLPFELPANGADGIGWNHRMPLRCVAAEAASRPLLFQPGTGYKYSNIGIDVAAAVVEKVTGEPWHVYLERTVLKPLGMTNTTFWPTDAQLATRLRGYNTKTNAPPRKVGQFGPMPMPYNGPTVIPSAGAGLWTTANDQFRFCRMLMNRGIGANGARILNETTVTNVLGWSKHGYSLGLWTDFDNGRLGHGGAWGTDYSVDWKKRRIKIWIVQLGSGPRPWDKPREAAEKAFFSSRAFGAP